MIATIHQPENMPWLGFFHKINMADIFIVLDNVQFRKNYFQNRNKIRTRDGWCWITVPVKSSSRHKINEVCIDDSNKRWKRKYLDSIYFAYKNAPFFDNYWEMIKSVIADEYIYISELNISLIKELLCVLNIKVRIICASEMDLESRGTRLLLDICQKVGADTYLSGISGKEYLKVDEFDNAGIDVVFQEFHHPIYRQLYMPFIPCMSVLDLLFNYGDNTLSIINGKNVPVIQDLFL